VEKRKPTYDLTSIQSDFSTVEGLRMTVSARNGFLRLGLSLTEVVYLIQGLGRSHFYKSMTCYGDHAVWQDVYHSQHQGVAIYLKFTVDIQGHLIISFKEK
jgi:motility quorum-sensing regulator / GCU-specific mRNA interferase toxin